MKLQTTFDKNIWNMPNTPRRSSTNGACDDQLSNSPNFSHDCLKGFNQQQHNLIFLKIYIHGNFIYKDHVQNQIVIK